MKPSEVLRAAATRLETHGWCQGIYRKDNLCCLVGAVEAICEDFDLDDCPIDYVAEDIRGGPHGRTPERWNDTPGRTAEEVIAQLRRTAERLEGEGR